MRIFMAAVIWALIAGTAHADALEGKRAPSEITASALDEDWRIVDPAQLMIIELAEGLVAIELSDAYAQRHVAQMKTLLNAGFYDGLSFYRVIDGFVAQGGDVFEERALPDGAVRGLAAEFDEASAEVGVELNQGYVGDGYAGVVSYYKGFKIGSEHLGPRSWLLHCAGALAMARDTEKNTATTEFYITLQPQRYLDRNLTVFGRVIHGMEHIQRLTRIAPPTEASDPRGDRIIRAYIAAAAPDGASTSRYRVLRTDSPLFAEYLESRRNRPEAFFYHRPDYVDICQTVVPVEMIEISAGE